MVSPGVSLMEVVQAVMVHACGVLPRRLSAG
jgi:hypothetical protein